MNKALLLYQRQDLTPIRKLLLMHLAAGGKLTDYTVTGNPAVFNTNVAKPLSGFTIPFLPVQSGTGDPSPENVRPISGWQGLTACRTGVNVFDASANPRRDGYLLNDNGVEQSSGSSGYTNGHISVIPGKKYTISGSIATGSGTWRIYNFDRNKEFIGRTSTLSSYIIPYTYTIPEDCYYIAIQYQTSYVDLSTIQIELGSTASPYTEYTGASYPVTFPDGLTIYGGHVDWVNGVAVMEWGRLVKTWGDFGNKTSLGDNTRGVYSISSFPSLGTGAGAMCNIAPRNTGWNTDSIHFYTNEGSCVVFLPNDTDASTEIQVVYPLATPIEVPLSDIPVPVTLIGDNTIWTDTNGENTVKYLKKG